MSRSTAYDQPVALILLERESPYPVDQWHRLTKWQRHADVVPLTRLTVITPPPTREGTVFVARSGVGPLAFDDPMEVVVWQPPGDGGPGMCRWRSAAGSSPVGRDRGAGARRRELSRGVGGGAAGPRGCPAFLDRVLRGRGGGCSGGRWTGCCDDALDDALDGTGEGTTGDVTGAAGETSPHGSDQDRVCVTSRGRSRIGGLAYRTSSSACSREPVPRGGSTVPALRVLGTRRAAQAQAVRLARRLDPQPGVLQGVAGAQGRAGAEAAVRRVAPVLRVRVLAGGRRPRALTVAAGVRDEVLHPGRGHVDVGVDPGLRVGARPRLVRALGGVRRGLRRRTRDRTRSACRTRSWRRR